MRTCDCIEAGFELILMTNYRAGTHFGEDGCETDIHKKVFKKKNNKKTAEQNLSFWQNRQTMSV